MEQFKKDIGGIFGECTSTLLWYIAEYQLDIQKAKVAFTDYVNEWFDKVEQEIKNEEI